MAVDKKNIFLSDTVRNYPYTSRSAFSSTRIPDRPDRTGHGTFLKKKFEEAYKQNQKLTQRQVAAIKYKEGIYLEFSGQENHDLVVKSLESVREGIRLLNVHRDEESETVKATVYVPEGKETYFINRLDLYLTRETKKGNL